MHDPKPHGEIHELELLDAPRIANKGTINDEEDESQHH